jgi:hypothetical protein
MALYRIVPLEKKSITFVAEIYRNNDDGSVSWFNIEDGYRWGQGFIDTEEDSLPYKEDQVVHCRLESGWGAELDDQCSCWFDFSDDITQEEREKIERCYLYGDDEDDGRGGIGWLYEGDHNWQLEDERLEIIGPYRVDLCANEYGDIEQEGIELADRPDPLTVWPFGPGDKNAA